MANTAYLGGIYDLQSFTFGSAQWVYIQGANRSSPVAAAETRAAMKIDGAGTLSLLTIQVTSNAQASGNTAVTSRRNSSAGNQALSIAFTTTGFFTDSSHSDAVSQGDTLDTDLVCPQTGSFVVTTEGYLYTGTSAVVGWLSTSDDQGGININQGTASSTKYVPVMGTGDNSNGWFLSTEANAQETVVSGATLSRLGAFVVSNSSTNSSSLTFRKNAAGGNQTISIGASSSGYIEDTSHTDAVVATNLIDVQGVTGAGTVNAALSFIVMTQTGSGASLDIRQGSTRTAGQGFSASVTNYLGICGSGIYPLATESNSQTQFPTGATFSNLIATVSATSGSTTQSMVFRKNAGTGNQTISINSASLGTVQDSSHSDSVSANDLVNIQLPAMTGASNISFSMIGLSLNGTPATTVHLSQVLATGAARTFTPSVSVALVQASATGVARSVQAGKGITLAGVQASGVARGLASSVGVPLSAARTAGQAGSFSFAASAKSKFRNWSTYKSGSKEEIL